MSLTVRTPSLDGPFPSPSWWYLDGDVRVCPQGPWVRVSIGGSPDSPDSPDNPTDLCVRRKRKEEGSR